VNARSIDPWVRQFARFVPRVRRFMRSVPSDEGEENVFPIDELVARIVRRRVGPVSIRIASHGHASTQYPQKMQRSSSMTNFTGKPLVPAALVPLRVLAGLDEDALRGAGRRAAEARNATRALCPRAG
jgi:hypothetical protein